LRAGALCCCFLGPRRLWSHGVVRERHGRLQEKETQWRRRCAV
jgi:hypothetical protein